MSNAKRSVFFLKMNFYQSWMVEMNYSDCGRTSVLLFSIVVCHERKINSSVCRLFSPNICQFWLRQLQIFEKEIAQNFPLGSYNALLTNQPKKFSFFPAYLTFLCYCPHSSNFSLLFLDVRPKFYCSYWQEVRFRQ